MWARHSIANKLRMVNDMIQSISESMKSLVGIDAAKGKLIGWLMSQEPQRVVVSVVGMGGSGKTTLSANIFKSRIVRKHFESHAWTTSLWREISIALPDGICGSRVMVTTPSNNVASFSYGIGSRKDEIELLKEDEAWILFCYKAFSGSLEQCGRRNLELIARRLLERSSTIWLIRSFLYCSLFPVNYQMKIKRIVRMWMAQRFVEPIRGVKAEEVADSYLNELVYRNMLQVILWNPFGRPKVFKMHDVIREIAISVSKAERFCDVYDNDNDEDDAETTEAYGTRHLCIQREMRSGTTVRKTNLHSLLVCSAAKQNIELPPSLNLLRALDLKTLLLLKDLQVMDCFNAEAELIKNLGNMTQLTRISLVMVRREHGSDLCKSLNKIKRLRFLSLTSINEEEPLEIGELVATTSIEKLFLAGKLERVPNWFNNLESLTYLGLCGSRLQENAIRCIQALPKLVWLSFYNAYMGPVLCFAQGLQNLKILDIVQMKHLTQVVIEDGALFELQKLHVRDCRGLESVPKGIENLVNLQELHLSHVSDQLVERIRGERSVDRSRVKHIPTIKHHFRNDDGSFYVSLSS
ncbi:unnamed protein product [Arabis nemorensis]|uniref:Uncharacterized protein n=1 Tax=Arabis nemorensis TaxID=586526 RepID=A0A565B5Z9_9BRAS|nr:unnamed protein product [Arabis nemorensis]